MTTTLRDLLPPALRETYDEAQRAEERFDHTGDAEALTIAGRSRHAIITGLTSTPDSPAAALFGVVHGLCRVLVKWYRATGDERAIDEALRGARQVLEHLEDDADPLRPRLLTELGNALRARYERTGSADDFAEARAAYEAAHDAEPDNPEGATNLATSYLDGFHRTGRIAELESSIELMHEALAGTRIGDVLGAGLRAGNLSGAYLRAWHVTGDPDDLDAAIGYGGDALHVLPPGSPPRAEAANNYGIALTERYKDAERPDPADLDAALRAHQEAVTLQPNTLRYRTNLATTHAMLGDLTGAVDTLRGVVDALPSDAPERPGALANLGTALIDRGEPGDIDAAVAVLRTAEAAAQHVHPEQVVRAAASLGAVAQARDAWPEAAAAFERALTAAAQLFGAQGTDTHRDLQLTGHGGLAAEAAYARFMAGDAATAAEDLEAGRALQLTEALGLDLADLDALDGAGHTALRDRFVAEVAWLRELAARPGDGDGELLVAARQQLAGTAAQIRAMPGFAEFLTPATRSTLVAAAATAPLVYLSAGMFGGLAVVVRPDGRVAAEALPGLTAGRVGEQIAELFDAYWVRQEDPAAARRWLDVLDAVTGWLWTAVADPLRSLLHGVDQATLVPCGLLGALPIHAAWTQGPAGRRYLLDELLVTYAPNARAVLAARGNAGRPVRRAVVVAQPASTGQPPLPGAAAEAAAVAAHFPAVATVTGAQATAAAVLAALPGADVLHAACHGLADPFQPRDSALLLAGDDRLTAGDLSRRLGSWRLSVLSACETGVPGLGVPDEAIGLPAGLLQAGAAGVIASLWAVPDTATALLMTRFYDRWRAAGADPPAALREAQRWLRQVTNGEAEALLPDLHDARYTGPAQWREDWAAARRFTHPVHWAAFCYFGA